MPLAVPPPRDSRFGSPLVLSRVHWVRPELVAEVRYLIWTDDGPQLGEPPAPTVWGKLKWYNPGKRYGFVELTDGSGDAFLHASAIEGMSTFDIGELQ